MAEPEILCEVSDDLIMPREEVLASSWRVPSGFQLTWAAMLEDEEAAEDTTPTP